MEIGSYVRYHFQQNLIDKDGHGEWDPHVDPFDTLGKSGF